MRKTFTFVDVIFWAAVYFGGRFSGLVVFCGRKRVK